MQASGCGSTIHQADRGKGHGGRDESPEKGDETRGATRVGPERAKVGAEDLNELPESVKRKRGRMNPIRRQLPVVTAALVGLAAGSCFFSNDSSEPGTRENRKEAGADASGVAEAQTTIETPELTAEERETVDVFERASPSVVFINNLALRRAIFSLDVEEIRQGSGTGFVWDSDGHIVTNFHVIAGARGIVVTLPDHTSWRASVVGVAEDKDLAVISIDAPPEKLVPLSIGRSDKLKVGMTTLAIGNPFGLDNSLTKGIVSALGREMTSVGGRTITDVIQTDAAINPGNSGGPLLDVKGRLIGVNTAIISRSGSSAGIGFAVPIDTVKRVVGQLIRYGRVIRPGLGAAYLQDYWLRRLGIDRGVMIRRVIPDSGAERAGLRGLRYFQDGSVELGDLVVKIDESEVSDLNDLLNVLEQHEVGDEVTVTYVRGRDLETAKVRLQATE